MARRPSRRHVPGTRPVDQNSSSLRTFRRALRTEESTALEPEVLDNKYYVAGIGEVFEGSVKGPKEVLRLVEIIT
jgi:hypothetical protein